MRPRAVLCGCVLVLAAGCGTRSGISVRSDVDACAAALPLAKSAVHQRGQLQEVRPMNRRELRRLDRELRRDHQDDRDPVGCAVAFRGDYRATGVEHAEGTGGRYAIVFVRLHPPTVAAVVLTDQLPRVLAG